MVVQTKTGVADALRKAGSVLSSAPPTHEVTLA